MKDSDRPNTLKKIGIFPDFSFNIIGYKKKI